MLQSKRLQRVGHDLVTEHQLSVYKQCIFLATKLCLTLNDLKDCSLPGSSVHEISQARILEWVAISFSSYKAMVGP